MKRIFWTQSAQDDLARIDDQYAEFDPGFANRVGRTAIAAGRFLLEYPAAGAEIAPGLRRWRVTRTPYLLFYRVVADGIDIVRVQHDRQDRSVLL